MAHCKIHNVRFYKPEPLAIQCMSLQPSTKKLAVARSHGSIEIWNLNNVWFLERTIASVVGNHTIQDVAWSNSRLFSVGLDGYLLEYDLHKLTVKNQCVLTGESGFCLDTNKNKVAVGTEQGYLNIFNIDDDGIYFEKFLDKQEGKIICLKFNPNGEFVVSGSTDVIRIWNVVSGHAIHKMTTGRSEANKATIVWCVEVTNDFTIITGDSRGKLTFWDGKVGSQLESYQSHNADILTLCLSEDQNTLCCAGVDPNIINYVKINVKGGTQKWVKSIQRKIHDHDVNDLVICDNKLYSGGADSYLACSFHPPKTLLKVPPILQSPCVSLLSEARYLMFRYATFVEVWSLGKSENAVDSYRGSLSLRQEPKKLLVLQKACRDFDGDEENEGVICSCMSNDGKWIMFSTWLGIRLYQLVYIDEKPNLLKIRDLENRDVPCVQAVFTPNSCQLITAPNRGGLVIYDLKDGRASINETLEDIGLTDTITFLTTSSCGRYLVAGDPSSNIVVWTLLRTMWTKYCKLPKYRHPPTALAVHPKTLNIVVAYSDNKLVEYNIRKRQFTEFSRYLENNLPRQWKHRSYPVRNIMFDPREDDIIILHDDSVIIIIDKNKKISQKNAKIPKIKTRSSVADNEIAKIPEELALCSIKKYKHLVHLGWLEGDEVVAVEVNPLTLLEQLPPAFVQNSFGQK